MILLAFSLRIYVKTKQNIFGLIASDLSVNRSLAHTFHKTFIGYFVHCVNVNLLVIFQNFLAYRKQNANSDLLSLVY